jgi:putative transposase
MAKRKRFTAEQNIPKLRDAEQGLSQGRTEAQVCKKFDVTEQTYYRWHQEYVWPGSTYED